MVMTLGSRVGALPSFLMMTSTLFRLRVAFGNPIGSGEGDEMKSSSMSLLGYDFAAGGFPPPTCFRIRVLARLGRRSGPSKSIVPL